MKIATWNLDRPKGNRAVQQAELMKKIDADIWVITETNGDTLLDGFSRHAWSHHDPEYHVEDEQWTTIWSRFDAERLELHGDPRRTACALISPPNRTPLVVYGTVLPWVGSNWHGTPSANSEAFIAALAAQLADWVSLREEYPKFDFCVAGDFNQDLNAQHYYGSTKGKAALRAALNQAGLECVTGGENDPVVRAGYVPSASIDHICLNSDLARKCRLPAFVWPGEENEGPRLSDHFGVRIEVQ